MISIDKRGDFWYGATAAFPKALEWHVWFDYWKDHLGSVQPAQRFLVDATVKIQQTFVHIARVVRKNSEFTRQYTEGEMNNIKAFAEEATMWYTRNRPREDQIRNLDPSLLILYKGLDGAYAVAERLANELDQINRKGYFLVDMSAENTELARSV